MSAPLKCKFIEVASASISLIVAAPATGEYTTNGNTVFVLKMSYSGLNYVLFMS